MAGFVPDSELAAIQDTAASSLDLLASVTRKTSSAPDGRSHQAPTWSAVLTNVACGMAEPSVGVMQRYPTEFIGALRRSVFSFPTGSDVRPDDRITTGGLIYRVQVRTDRDSYSALVQCIASQINTAVN